MKLMAGYSMGVMAVAESRAMKRAQHQTHICGRLTRT